MNTLFDLLAEVTFSLSPFRLASLENQAEKCATAPDFAKLPEVWGPGVSREKRKQVTAELLRHPEVTGRDLAVAFRMARSSNQWRENSSSIDLLWSGPYGSTLAVRKTEQALCELINAAKKKIIIVSFVAYKAELVLDALSEAIERGVTVRFLLEMPRELGGTLDMDCITPMRKAFPKAKFYIWNPETNPDSGVVHAKCAVADESMALITSANLTEKAMDYNMEVGVLFKNGHIPRQLAEHWERLYYENIVIESRK